ncbi:MAG TPA: hypothetical protein VMJ32_00170 [Pirellulales bacterium]|nr:hypothetical protein [Pirellulales bacterium]
MPYRHLSAVPTYRHHKPSGQAVVTINGQDFYLGLWNSAASRGEYDRRIAEWLACGRQPPAQPAAGGLTVSEMLVQYWEFAKRHYRKHGRPSEELKNIRYALRPLRRLYGHTLACDFGPLALKALQQRMISDDLSRGVINSRIGKIKRVFRWAVSE